MNKDKGTPVRIVIGVTGHRRLKPNDPAVKRIPEVLAKIEQRVSFRPMTPLVFTVLSPLAEGADRLVASEVLKTPDACLEVILPLGKGDYLRDFKRPESKKEFEVLLKKAGKISRIPQLNSRVDAYRAAGRFVVDNCDILIALWDGRPSSGGGGTAEIVEYARQRKRALYWLNTEDAAELTYESGSGINVKTSARPD